MSELRVRNLGTLGLLGVAGVVANDPALFGLFGLFALFASDRTVTVPFGRRSGDERG